MSTKEAYEKKLEAQLAEWNADIEKLKAKANKAEGDIQLEYNKRIDDLHAMRESVEIKLHELKNSSGSAWEDLKVGLDGAFISLDEAVKSAISRFK